MDSSSDESLGGSNAITTAKASTRRSGWTLDDDAKEATVNKHVIYYSVKEGRRLLSAGRIMMYKLINKKIKNTIPMLGKVQNGRRER